MSHLDFTVPDIPTNHAIRNSARVRLRFPSRDLFGCGRFGIMLRREENGVRFLVLTVGEGKIRDFRGIVGYSYFRGRGVFFSHASVGRHPEVLSRSDKQILDSRLRGNDKG
jgi:hypothetical protein